MSRADFCLVVLMFQALSSCSALDQAEDLFDTPIGPDKRFALLGGVASLDEAFGEFESPVVLGFELSSEDNAAPIGWEAGMLHSSEDGSEGTLESVRLIELYLGARRGLEYGPYTLHAGFGLSYTMLSSEQDTSGPGGPPIDFVGESPDDTSIGGYLLVGIRRRLIDAVDTGLWARIRDGQGFDIAPGPVGIDARSAAVGFSLGLRY